MYYKYIKPEVIDTADPKLCTWIYQILEKKKEIELTVYENDEFILQKDYKFNEGDMKTFYCAAYVKRRDL